jgi:hypothetical protein
MKYIVEYNNLIDHIWLIFSCNNTYIYIWQVDYIDLSKMKLCKQFTKVLCG